ncbi:restriction endonuclease subunit S [Bacillus pumilus]|uniref:restriction endonuclease subunit S n=1 Tax=Bacillus pumilus TaxID=1408 RepID=UPI00349ED73D
MSFKVKLKDVALLKNGKKITKKESGRYEVFGANGPIGYSDEFLLEKESIILGRVGANCGSVHYSSKPIWISDNTIGIVPKDNVDGYYLYYILSSLRLNEMAAGSAQPLINQSIINSIDLNLINLDKQKKVGAFLQYIDEKIKTNKEIILTLEQISQTLFKHWFIDFEFLNEEEQPYKSSGGKMVESELGEIPKDWVIGKAGNILEFSPIEKIAKNKTATFVEMKNLNTSAMVYDYLQKPFKSGSKFRNGDTLLARITPCLENGKIGFVDFLNENEVGWGSTEFITIRTKNNIASSFSYYFASEQNFKNYAIKNMNGSSGRQRVKAETLINYLIAIPPNELIKKFTDISEPNMQMMTKLKEETLILRKVRDTLLPKLLSGEIEIPDELEV